MANTLVSSGGAAAALVFESTTFEVITRDDQPWLGVHQLGVALGYKRSDAIAKLYRANAAEFTESMTALVKLPTAGGEQETRIFSLRGAHLLAMFARTAIAALFRKWVLDILEHHSKPEPRIAYAVNPGDTLTAAQAEQLRLIFKDKCDALPKDEQAAFMTKGWSKLKSHFGVTYRKIEQREFSEALSLATRHAADWAVTPQLTMEPAPMIEAPSLKNRRWLVYFDHTGREHHEAVPNDAMVCSPKEIPGMLLNERNGIFTAKDVMEIAGHANLRMMTEVCNLESRSKAKQVRDEIRTFGTTDLSELAKTAWLELSLRGEFQSQKPA